MLNDFELKRKEVAALDEIAQTLDKISDQYTYLIERLEEEFEAEHNFRKCEGKDDGAET